MHGYPRRRSHPDHPAAGSKSEKAAVQIAAARLRLAFSRVRAARQISLCGETAVHADRRAQGGIVPPACVPRFRTRRVRSIDLSRQRQFGAGRPLGRGRGPLSRRRAPRSLDAAGRGRSLGRRRRAWRAAAFLFSARRRADAARRYAAGDRESGAERLAYRHASRRPRGARLLRFHYLDRGAGRDRSHRAHRHCRRTARQDLLGAAPIARSRQRLGQAVGRRSHHQAALSLR